MSAQAQYYVNKEWVRETGLPDQLDWSASVLDPLGHLIVVGNTLNGPDDPDMLVTKYDRDGNVVWQHTYGGSAGAQDYGVAVSCDQLGNVFVAGVVTTTAGFLDIALLRYQPNGTLAWAQVWGSGPGMADVATSMALDGAGGIYIAGSTYSTPTNPDFLLIKFSANGAVGWNATYDHVGLIDAATGVVVDVNSNPVVSGASASAANAWDFATVKYDAATGAQLDAVRVTVPGVGLDNVLAFTRDDQGSIFITGSREVNGVKDMQTVKLNADLSLGWVKDYDAEGLNDAGRSVDADNAGNVFVAGYSRKINGGSDMVTVKYAADGSVLWGRHYKANDPTLDAEATKCAATNDGGVIVVGTVHDGTSTNFRTLKYSANGTLEWTREHDGLIGDDRALDLVVDHDGRVYVGGRSGSTYSVVKYASYLLNNGTITDENGTALAKDNELLVTFYPSLVNTLNVDDKNWQWGTLDQIVPAHVADSIGLRLGSPPGSGKQIKVFKVYRNTTTADSTSTRRLGTIERLQPYWNTFLLNVDLGSDPPQAIQAVGSLTQFVERAQANLIYHPYSNDPLYQTHQFSLRPNATFPDADINVEGAWNIQTGSPDIRVGIVDEMLASWHPDFQTLSGSKVLDGWSYPYYQSISDWSDANFPGSESHGNACAAIVGAVRNNEEGIAGIAGGDALQDEYGVSLYSVGIFEPGFPTTSATVVEAVRSAAQSGNGNGQFACHALNNSYGAYSSSPLQNEFNDGELRRAIQDVFRNECVFTVAKGNGAAFNYPADFVYSAPWRMIAVGAGGPDGSLMTEANGGYTMNGTPDLIAPGHAPMIATAIGQNAPYPFQSTCPPVVNADPQQYGCFRFSSAATPHVTGVVGLMLSEHRPINGYPNGLAPEDVKNILLMSATDISGGTSSYPVGPDPYNGHGRLDASHALELVSTPYSVHHSSFAEDTDVEEGPVQTIYNQSNGGFSNMWGLPAGSYEVQPVTYYNSFTDVFGPTVEVQLGLAGSGEDYAFWGRQSSTDGLLTFDGDPNAVWQFSFDAIENTLYVSAWTTFYKVISGPNGTVNQWVPFDPALVNHKPATPYSVLVRELDDVAVNDVERERLVRIFPNPSNDLVSIAWTLDALDLEVFDAVGRTVYQQRNLQGPKRHLLNVSDWASGVYSIRVIGSEGQQGSTFIKY